MEFRQGLALGSVVGGDYRIVDVLGQGGFGLTYKGFDNRLGSTVAIKEYFPADMALREDGASVRVRSTREEGVFSWGREKFLDEAKTLARFRHNNIVRVARLFEENNTAYMVLDFEEGPSLSQWRDKLDRPPRQDELDRIASQLLDAVAVVHAGGILHRDIKPQNVIMRGGNEAVLIDFGAARASLGQRSKTVHAIVTPGYSPKEQYALDVDRQGPWSDIYALGATLYFLITGHSPPDALTRDLEDAMPMETDGREPYRESFLAAIDAAMHVRSEDRPRSIEEWRPMLFREAPSVLPGRWSRPGDVATVLAPASRRPPVTRNQTVRPPTVRTPSARAPLLRDITEPGHRVVSFDELQPAVGAAQPATSYARPLIAAGAVAIAAAASFGFYTFVIQPGQDEAAWQSAQLANSIEAYDAYLARRPNGRFASDARERRQRIATVTPAPGPVPPPTPTPPSPPAPVQPAPPPTPTPTPSPTPVTPTPAPPGPSTQQQPEAPQPPAPKEAPPPAPTTPARVALTPRDLPPALSEADFARVQQSVGAAQWRFVPFASVRLPGLSDQSADFTNEMTRLSGGRITIATLDVAQVGGSNQVLAEVRKQHDLMGWHTPFQSQSRNTAYLIFHGVVPFGLPPADHVRWLRADGARLLEALYHRDRFFARYIPCGIGGQPGGWYRREIKSPSDFRGLKVRFVGLGGEVLKRLGAEGTGTSSTDLAAAFAANTVDVALFNTSLTGIFVKKPAPARVFHYPGWHAPSYLFELVISPELWTAMSQDQKSLVDEVCRRNLDKWAVQFSSSQTEMLTQVRNSGILIRPYTAPTLEALRKATDEVLAEESEKNPDFKRILESYNQFRRPR